MLENVVIVWCWTKDPILLEVIGLKFNNWYTWWQKKGANVEGREREGEREIHCVGKKYQIIK